MKVLIVKTLTVAPQQELLGGLLEEVMVGPLTVRVCVDGFHELSIGRVQSVEGVSSFKHGSSWVQACMTGAKTTIRLLFHPPPKKEPLFIYFQMFHSDKQTPYEEVDSG